MSVISGVETIKRVRESQVDTLLAFSTGKDSIVTWLSIRDHFDKVIPFYLYSIPGLDFIDESLDYYERFFETKITRLPHPRLHRMLNEFTFQTPERCLVIEQSGLPSHSYEDIHDVMRRDFKLPDNTMTADGVRAADSPMRRIAINTHGPISFNLKRYHPIWDKLKDEMLAIFEKSGVKLPEDYKLFGRSFDGFDLRFMLPLKKHRPADYQKVLEWFPLVELEIFRWECANA